MNKWQLTGSVFVGYPVQRLLELFYAGIKKQKCALGLWNKLEQSQNTHNAPSFAKCSTVILCHVT